MSFQLRLGRTLGVLVFCCGVLGAQTAVALPILEPHLPPVHEGDGPPNVDAPQLWGVAGGGSVELGQTVVLRVSYNGSGEGQSYVWRKGDAVIVGATLSTYEIAAAAPSDAETYSVTVSNSSGSSVASVELTVRAAAALVFTTQPPANVRYVGQTAMFAYSATGSFPRTHQWRKNGVDIPGANLSSYEIGVVTMGDAGVYSVVVTNSFGSVTSVGASLTVNAAIAPVIPDHTPTDVVATLGDSAGFSVYYSNGTNPFTYQWLKNGTPLPGATNAQLIIAATRYEDAGKYSVIVTNAAGSATSHEATLTVNAPTPVTITSHPESATVYEGENTSFRVYSSGSDPKTYQWRKNGTPIAGATTAYLNLSQVTLAEAGSYTVVITNAAGSVTSFPATLVVNPATMPTISLQPVESTVDYGAILVVSVKATGSPPLTYQWFKDGESLSYAGSFSSYERSNASPADSGVYTVVVKNPAGSVTSQAVSVTVKPAVAPTITLQPLSQTLAYGVRLRLSVDATGSPQLAYQWKKDGVPLSSGSGRSYSVNEVTPAANGSYTVMVSNSAGSVTSEPAVVTVNAAIPPLITTHPQAQTVSYGGTISLSAQATGSPPLRYEWLKDGVALGWGNTSSRYVSGATSEHVGVYSVVVTNAAGSVTSANAVVSVGAPVLPRFTEQPKSLAVAVGLEASFSASYTSEGAGNVQEQWHKNGTAIPGATSRWLRISPISASDAGDYTFVLTSVAGTVTSAVAKLTVLPPVLPSVSSWPVEWHARYGEDISFGIYSLSGSPPFSYQWFKDGVAIPGAVKNTYEVVRATEADLGIYTVTIANAAGLIGSPPMVLRWSPYDSSVPTGWLDAARSGDIVYFPAVSPARIERYDLANERWLPAVALSTAPTALAVAGDGVYLAYDRSIVRRSLDLGAETQVANTVAPTKQLFVFGDYLYHNGTSTSDWSLTYVSIHRTSLQPGGAVALKSGSNAYRHIATSGSLRAGFSRGAGGSPDVVEKFTFGADGSIVAAGGSSGITYRYPAAKRVYLLPGDALIADDAGSVYRTSDLAFVGSFGSGFDDLAFRSDHATILLRGNKLASVPAETITATNTAELPRYGQRIFTRGTDTFVFGRAETANGTFSVTKVAATDFKPPTATILNEPPVGPYSVDDAFLGADEAVHVFSRTLEGLVRWSARTRSFLPTVKLRSAPLVASHQPESNRALFYYPDGSITRLPLGAGKPVEQRVGAMNLRTRALIDLGDRVLLNVSHAQDSGDTRMLLGPGATLVQQPGYGYFSTARIWLSGTRRLYSAGQTYSTGTFQYEVLPETGELPAGTATSATANLLTPLRFNPEGALAVSGNGVVVNADLVSVGALANDISDAAWLSDGLYTLRALDGQSELQRWTGASYLRSKTLMLPGTPVRLFRLSDLQLVAVTSAGRLPLFTVLNQGLTVSTAASSHISITSQPISRTVAPGAGATMSFGQTGAASSPTYRWLRNGVTIAGGNQSTLSISSVQPADAGVFTAQVVDANGQADAAPAVLGVSTSDKVIGAGSEVGPDIVHPNRNVYDQLLLEGAAASLTADTGEVARISFIDLNDDIVQVEFTGAGTLSLVLTGSSGPAAPANYSQPTVRYMKGHAGIVISGADETTNVSVFTVGRATAFDPTGAFNLLQPITAVNDPLRNGSPLFQDHGATAYDGIADLAYIAVLSESGRFGGIRAANAHFVASAGITGVYAPGVTFAGPVYIGNIDAFGEASPFLVLGSADDVRITGGDLQQTNSRAIKIAGVTKLRFVDGSTSHGTILPAQNNRTRFDQAGVDVTDQIVVNPGQ
jgi:hypothetical protein